MINKNHPLVVGVGGFARAGKDTFVKVASKILHQNGYTTQKLAFADALKNEIGPFIKEFYGIDVWTDNTDEKTLIRPLLVAHGCQKRVQTNGTYWVEKVDKQIDEIIANKDVSKHIIFVSDCRFPNEVDWVHKSWHGWFVHLKKYKVEKRCDPDDYPTQYFDTRIFDAAPNEEEAKNDPICERNADTRLSLENIVAREQRLND